MLRFDEHAPPAHQLVRQGSHVRFRLLRQLLSHLNCVCGEINAALIAIAIGLAVLDYFCFLQWEISAALGR